MARIDDAVSRILTAKFEMGLFEQQPGDLPPLSTVGAAEHRALAREAAARGMVLLQDDGGTLPIRGESIFVSGEAADNIGLQCGGWTIKWQGEVTRDLTIGTTILDGLREVAPAGTRIDYSPTADFPGDERAAVGVAFLHELPYAEGLGDRADLNLTADQVALIEKMRPRCQRLVVVLITGRPLLISDHLARAEAWVAAWLPGSEGGAVADVLFGRMALTGRLPLAWPK